MVYFLLAVVLAAGVVSPAAAVDEQPYDEYEDSPTVYMEKCGVFPAVRLMVDGKETEGRAFIRHARTYMPAREALEELGAEVTWVQDQKAFYARFPEQGRTVRVAVGSRVVNVYRYSESGDYGAGEHVRTVSLDVEPFRCEGRVFIPVRAATEAAGGRVHFDKDANTVYVYGPKQ